MSQNRTLMDIQIWSIMSSFGNLLACQRFVLWSGTWSRSLRRSTSAHARARSLNPRECPKVIMITSDFEHFIYCMSISVQFHNSVMPALTNAAICNLNMWCIFYLDRTRQLYVSNNVNKSRILALSELELTFQRKMWSWNHALQIWFVPNLLLAVHCFGAEKLSYSAE